MLWCLSQSNGFVDHAVVRQLRKSVYLFSSRICVKEHDRETVLGLRELTLCDRLFLSIARVLLANRGTEKRQVPTAGRCSGMLVGRSEELVQAISRAPDETVRCLPKEPHFLDCLGKARVLQLRRLTPFRTSV